MTSREPGIKPIDDFIKYANLCGKVQNIINAGVEEGRFYYLTVVTFHNYILIKGAGFKSWSDLLDAVKRLLFDDMYEPQWKEIFLHFRNKGGGHFF